VALRPPLVVAVNAVVAVDVDDALGDLGLPPQRNSDDDDDDEKMLNSFGRRQLQPMSTTGGCRSGKLPPLLLDDLPPDMLTAGCKCVCVCTRTTRLRSHAHKERGS
jgi:hypothetical protein